MPFKADKKLDELRNIRLALFRSAACLDDVIKNIERLDGSSNDEYVKLFIRTQRSYREDCVKIREYDKLNEQEQNAWQNLIDSLK